MIALVVVAMVGMAVVAGLALVLLQARNKPPVTTVTTPTPSPATPPKTQTPTQPRGGGGGRLAKPGKPLPASAKIVGDDAFANLPLVSGGIRGLNRKCTYHYYSPMYTTSTLACADFFHKDSDYGRKLMRLPWVAYCVTNSVNGVCGKCFRLTNKRTGAQINVRAVDQCFFGGVDVDPAAYNSIDTDGQGYRDGHMMLDIEEVQCPRDASF